MDIISYLLGKKAGGGGSNLQVKSETITSNGSTTINPDQEYDGMSKVNLNVNVQPDLESTSVTISTNTTTTITPSQDKDGLSSVEVITNVPQPTGTINISTNGITDVTNYASANVNVAGAEAPDNDVNFYDYDGTRVYSYSKDDFLALTEMPANPSHTGLTAQGWNWSLADAKEYVTDYGMLEIGQYYVTDDEKTRIYINLDNDRKKIYLAAKTYTNGPMLIEWGDGTDETVNLTTSLLNTPHEYATGGKYTISISRTDTGNGKIYIPNNSNMPIFINGGNTSYGNINMNQYYNNVVEKIELGSRIEFQAASISNYRNLETITIPNIQTGYIDLGNISNGTFQNCINLKFALSQTSYMMNAYKGCTNLKAASISKGGSMEYAGSFGSVPLNKLCLTGTSTSYAQNDLTCIPRKLIIPNSVTNLNRSFGSAYLQYVHLPNNCESMTSLFKNASNYLHIEIPSKFDGLVSASNFINIYGVITISFLGNVISIESTCFTKAYALKTVDFSNCTAVPTLGTGCFTNIPTDCKIIVPDTLYENWIAASNWSSLASNIVKASEA